MAGLVEIDSLEALVIIDNELDVLSWTPPNTVESSGKMRDIALEAPSNIHGRGVCLKELRMDRICCAAHGLSILVTATKGKLSHSVLFDAGPEESAWERNVERLSATISSVEVIQLSHWHRDHSGGLLKAIRMIKEAKTEESHFPQGLVADLHPDRPDYRGLVIGSEVISMEADPTFAEIEAAGAAVETNSKPHTVLDNMFLVSGEIPRMTPYENGVKYGLRFDSSTEQWQQDELILDERFLMCNVKDKGIVVFTGCSHAGVVNTARHAVELLGSSVPLHAVVGGYHLAVSHEEEMKQTVKDLKALDPAMLLPGHCSGWRVKYEIEKEMPGRLVPCTVGAKFTF